MRIKKSMEVNLMYSVKYKKVLSITLIAVFALLIAFLKFSNKTSATTINEITNKAIENLENSNSIENIKITHADKSTEEFWKEIGRGNFRTENRDEYGNLINTLIICENGRRVINISYTNGKLEGETWVLPDKFAKANQEISKKSLFEDIINDIKSTKWNKLKQNMLVEGRKVDKLSLAGKYYEEVLYTDNKTGFPIKRVSYRNDNGKKKLLEERFGEYKIINDDSGEVFKYGDIELKEVPAPVVGDELGQG